MLCRFIWVHLNLGLLLLCCGYQVQAAAPIVLATGSHYAPFAAQNLPRGGMLVEIVQTAWQVAGYQSHTVFMPWRRGFYKVKRGDFKGTYPHSLSKELKKEYYYSDPLFLLEPWFYVHPNSKLKYKNTSSLNNLRFCSPNGRVIHPVLQKLIDTAAMTVSSPRSFQSCAMMLMKRRVDFLVLDKRVYKRMLAPTIRLKSLARQSRLPLHLLLSKRDKANKALLKAFNRGLKQIKQQGVYDHIIQMHLGINSP